MSGAGGRRAPGVDAVVVAAGSSRRMAGSDKLATKVAGRPLLAWTLAALAGAPEVERIVVVTAPDRVEALRLEPWLPAAVEAIVAGGPRRQESVAAGVRYLERADRLPGTAVADDRVVLVHDGARPAVRPALVAAVAAAALAHGAAIPIVPVVETLKQIEGDRVTGTVDRHGLAAAQTPQGFRRSLLRAAYATLPPEGPTEWTDEAALCEACKIPVHVISGDPTNLKVTLPADLERAEAVLRPERVMRVGLGRDSHPFGPGEPLALGGVEFPGGPRLHGHSDGDVALHAVADALLGAAGLGDLGRLFPAGPATPRGIASTELLGEVVRRVAAAGWRPVATDLTIIGARPRLADRLESMRLAVAAVLGVQPAAVSVKASSGNLAGMEGAGRGITAEAIVQIEAVR